MRVRASEETAMTRETTQQPQHIKSKTTDKIL